ncbi:hypothetical protein FKP32DRAFT_175231 [Trametes sanguinea]|nr:hypothetical protein FKP32DRAFT_175231 [Trametes sanguinea]
MQLSFVVSVVAVLAGASSLVRAEQHTIRFENKCGKGTPQLIQGGKVLSTGEDYTSNGPFSAGIAYLQTGECGFNGEKCAIVEMTLVNPTAPGAGSSTDISLITPHAFNVETSFSYFGSCTGQGATCSSGTCKTAFFQPNDNQVQVQCENNDVNLLITFCGDATTSSALTDKSSGSSSQVSIPVVSSHSSSAAEHTSSAVHTTAAAHPTTSAAASTHAASTVVVSSSPSLVAEPSTTSAANAASSAAASRPSCKAGSRRRRSLESSGKLRRHHARNAEAAAHRGASF